MKNAPHSHAEHAIAQGQYPQGSKPKILRRLPGVVGLPQNKAHQGLLLRSMFHRWKAPSICARSLHLKE